MLYSSAFFVPAVAATWGLKRSGEQRPDSNSHLAACSDALANEPRPVLQRKDAEVEFFDRLTQVGDYDVFANRGYERILGEFAAYLQPLILARRGPLKAVDLGCGTGAFTSRLQRFDITIHGVDISSQSVARAAQKFPQIDFRIGDIEAVPFGNDTFDVVFLSGVLHHFPDLTQTVAECGRILKPGGVVLAYDPHRGNPVMWAYRCKDSPFYSANGVTPNEQPLSKDVLRRAFRVEPFEEVRVDAVSGVTFKYVASRGARFLLPVYNFVERCFDLPLVRERFGSFLITYARKRS